MEMVGALASTSGRELRVIPTEWPSAKIAGADEAIAGWPPAD